MVFTYDIDNANTQAVPKIGVSHSSHVRGPTPPKINHRQHLDQTVEHDRSQFAPDQAGRPFLEGREQSRIALANFAMMQLLVKPKRE